MSSSNGANGQSANNGKSVNGHSGTSAADSSGRSSARSSAGSSSVFGTMMKFRPASRRPLPTEMGDGTYRVIDKRPTLRQDLRTFTLQDLKTLYQIVASKVKGETQMDDKTMIMERTIKLVAGLPNHSKTQEILTNTFIDELWNSLDHPPMLYMGDKFKWRHADGSFNNPMLPNLGAAGQPYSRTVKPHVTGLGARPDPETIYEAVMARDGFRRNPNNVSSILWYWATIIIHDLFWTNMRDGNINDSSSYLDLAPLYGHSQDDQNTIRTFKDGMLKPDSFADKRLIANPPGVPILLIMFNRFHNHVATMLAAINEDNRFPKPASNLEEAAAAAAWKKYDEELFQTARLITSGLYINITLVDYVRNIVNMNRMDSEWTLDPRQEMGVAAGTSAGSQSGVGNAVSAEFNLCYRWHSCISEMDDLWIQNFYKELLGDSYGDMSMQVLIAAVKKFEMTVPKDPGQRTFGGMKRGPDGKYDDDKLVEALATAIEQPGGAFGARNVPRILKPVEVLGIIRGRRWNLAGLNEFRKHFGLKAYTTFEEINSDPVVAENLRNLYQHPDYVELYPGIVAEEAKKPMVPGVGIAPTFTISRVVLSDAVSLVRGDRYYTTDYHPGNVTNWGFTEANYDLKLNHGCVFYKLFLKAFPNHFKGDSVYAHYPMVIPPENRKILTNLKRVDKFSFDRPGRRAAQVYVTSHSAAKYVIASQNKYNVTRQDGLEFILGQSGRGSPLQAIETGPLRGLIYKDGWKEAVRAFYSKTTERLLAEKSYKLAGKPELDVVRDVGNLAHTHFVASLFNLPLKDKGNPRGIFSEQELYKNLALIAICMFSEVDTVREFPLHQAAKETTSKLGQVIETNVKLTTSLGMGGLYTSKSRSDLLPSYGVNLIKGLSKAGLKPSDMTWAQIIPTAAAFVPTEGQLFAQAVDWHLSPAGDAYRDVISRVAAEGSSASSDALLLGYAMEGIRMSGASSLYREAGAADVITEDDGRQTTIRPGDHVFVSFAAACKDAVLFPEPDQVNPSRPMSSYTHYGAGPLSSLTRDISEVALVEMFRALFRKKGLRRLAGAQGELKKVVEADGTVAYMSEDWGSTWPFPTSMKVTWDE